MDAIIKIVYLSMAYADLDYVCELARDFGFWSEVSDNYLLETLAMYAVLNTKAKPTVQTAFGEILDMAIAYGRDEIEEPGRYCYRESIVLDLSSIIAVFNYKELMPKAKEALDVLGYDESTYKIVEEKDSTAMVNLHNLDEDMANSGTLFRQYLLSLLIDE